MYNKTSIVWTAMDSQKANSCDYLKWKRKVGQDISFLIIYFIPSNHWIRSDILATCVMQFYINQR